MDDHALRLFDCGHKVHVLQLRCSELRRNIHARGVFLLHFLSEHRKPPILQNFRIFQEVRQHQDLALVRKDHILVGDEELLRIAELLVLQLNLRLLVVYQVEDVHLVAVFELESHEEAIHLEFVDGPLEV